jgi:thiol:disulfide interchange protein
VRGALLIALVLACSSQRARWLDDEATAFARARAEHKGVLVQVYASWSLPSVELDAMLHAPELDGVIARSFVPVKLDVTNGTDRDVDAQQRYRGEGVVLVDASGTVLARISGAGDQAGLHRMLEDAAGKLPRR